VVDDVRFERKARMLGGKARLAASAQHIGDTLLVLSLGIPLTNLRNRALGVHQLFDEALTLRAFHDGSVPALRSFALRYPLYDATILENASSACKYVVRFSAVRLF